MDAPGSRPTLSLPYEQLLELLPGSVTATDPTGHIVYWSAGSTELFGYTADETLGRHIQAVFNVLDAQDHERNVEQAQRSDAPREFRFTARHKDGTPLAIIAKTRPLLDAQGKLLGAVGLTQLASSAAAVELPADELRFRRLLDSTAEGVYEVDLSGTFTFVNRAGLRLLGLEFSYQLLGKSMRDVFRSAHEGEDWQSPLTGAVSRESVPQHALEEEIRVADGQARTVEVWSHPVTKLGQQIGRVLTVFDVADRVAAEQSQRRTEDDFVAMMDQSPDMVMVHVKTELVYANKRLLDMLGVDAQTAMGMNVAQLFHPEDAAQLAEVIELGRKGLPSYTPEWKVRGKGDVFRPMEVRGFSVTFRGQPARVVVGRDLAERKELETQMRMNERLASLGTLAAGMAHEINNPLAYIGNNLDFLFGEMGDLAPLVPRDRSESIMPAISDSIDGVRRIGEIVGHLKTLTRSSEAVESLSLEDCLDHALKLASNQVIHRAQIRRQLGPLPLVRGNATRLTQVFVNLLVNAAQAIPEGSAERNIIHVRAFTNARQEAIIEVEDTGVGIDPEVQKRVFDPFFTTKPVGVGTGLGLSICHGIVVTYGGEITLESKPGEGTTVRVRLPSDTTVKESPVTVRAAPKPPRLRMLVIDDEPAFLRALRRSLAEHDVVTMSNAQSGLDAIRGGVKFDLVLCDVMMPQMTGEQFYAQLQSADPELAGRTLFMTGGTFSQGANQFVEDLPAVLRKPFPVGDLRAAIAERMAKVKPGSTVVVASPSLPAPAPLPGPSPVENAPPRVAKPPTSRGKRASHGS